MLLFFAQLVLIFCQRLYLRLVLQSGDRWILALPEQHLLLVLPLMPLFSRISCLTMYNVNGPSMNRLPPTAFPERDPLAPNLLFLPDLSSMFKQH